MKDLLIIKRFVFLLICTGCVFALQQCSKSEFSNEDCEECLCVFDFAHDKTASIIGKWKLEKIRVSSRLGISCMDCSSYNVLYEFKQNGTLTVSGNTKNLGCHESGEYSFIKDEWSMGRDDYPWGLKINYGSTNWYMLSSKKLIIDYSPGDGATYYFVKKQ